LEDHIPTFAATLAGSGYAKSTAKEQIRLVAELGRWLDRKGILVAEIDERRVAEFLAHGRGRGRPARGHRTTLRILLGVLRNSAVARPIDAVDADMGATPITEIVRAFTWHLDGERGLHASTRGNYASVVQRLLARRFRSGPVKLGELRPDGVSRFVVHQARTSSRRMKVIVPALRAFLRWLHQRGDTETSLVGCVPAVADWRLATVPKALP